MARIIVMLEMDTESTVHDLRDAARWNSALNFADAYFGSVLQASAMRAKGVEAAAPAKKKKGGKK